MLPGCLCLPFAPSISDCSVLPFGQEVFIFLLLLLDCLEVACLVSAHVNSDWIIFFLLYSANELCGFECVRCLRAVLF